MKLVSWNCKGLGGKQNLEAIKRFRSTEENAILSIQEKKIQEGDYLILMSRNWARGEGKAVSASGASGGLFTRWDKQRYNMLSALENRNWLFIELEDKDS